MPEIETPSDEQVAAVRFLIADFATPPLITDEQIKAAWRAEGKVELLAAARCLEAIAVSETLISKKIRTQDLTTDGPAVAAELRAQAQDLRARAADQDEQTGWDGFDVVPTVDHGHRRPEHTMRPYETWGL